MYFQNLLIGNHGLGSCLQPQRLARPNSQQYHVREYEGVMFRAMAISLFCCCSHVPLLMFTLESLSLLPSCSMITISLHITITLIIPTFLHLYIYKSTIQVLLRLPALGSGLPTHVLVLHVPQDGYVSHFRGLYLYTAVSCFMWSGALESQPLYSHLLPSHHTVALASHTAIVLTFTLQPLSFI